MDQIILMRENLFNITLGAGTPLAGFFVSISTYNEQLQTLSLVIGCLVGLGTLVNIIYRWMVK